MHVRGFLLLVRARTGQSRTEEYDFNWNQQLAVIHKHREKANYACPTFPILYVSDLFFSALIPLKGGPVFQIYRQKIHRKTKITLARSTPWLWWGAFSFLPPFPARVTVKVNQSMIFPVRYPAKTLSSNWYKLSLFGLLRCHFPFTIARPWPRRGS